MRRACFLLTALLLGLGCAQATTIQFDLQYLFNGDMPANTTTPWARATITDQLDPVTKLPTGTVTLTMQATNLYAPLSGTGEFIGSWWFNIAPFPTSLSVNWSNGVQAANPGGKSGITQGLDCCSAVPDGNFDLRFDFLSNTFTNGLSSTYTISATGLDALDFQALSQPNQSGQTYGFPTMAHVQNVGGLTSKSGLVTNTPEPATFGLIGLVLIGGTTILRRRFSA